MKTLEFFEESLTCEGQKKWANKRKKQGWSIEKIQSVSDYMYITWLHIKQGRLVHVDKNIRLTWPISKGTFYIRTLKENESLEIYRNKNSLCQVMIRDGIPVGSEIYDIDSEFGEKAIITYGLNL